MAIVVPMETDLLTLNSGQQIRTNRLLQYRTYGGMLLGLPNPMANEMIISDALKRAEQFGGDGKPYLIQPRVMAFAEWWLVRYGKRVENTDEPLPECAALPAIACIAQFEAMDKLSVVAVVWFQNEFAFPIAPEIMAQIVALNWDSVSTECSP